MILIDLHKFRTVNNFFLVIENLYLFIKIIKDISFGISFLSALNTKLLGILIMYFNPLMTYYHKHMCSLDN